MTAERKRLLSRKEFLRDLLILGVFAPEIVKTIGQKETKTLGGNIHHEETKPEGVLNSDNLIGNKREETSTSKRLTTTERELAIEEVHEKYGLSLVDSDQAAWSLKEIAAVEKVIQRFPPEAIKRVTIVREDLTQVKELTSENNIRIFLPQDTLMANAPDKTLALLWKRLENKKISSYLQDKFNSEVWKLEWLIAHGLVHVMTSSASKTKEEEILSFFRNEASKLGIFWVLPEEATPSNIEALKNIARGHNQDILEITSILTPGKILFTGKVPTRYARLHPNEAMADFGAFWYLSSQPRDNDDYGFFKIPISFYRDVDTSWRSKGNLLAYSPK